MLNDALARAGITDAAGQILHYTAHDFRRMFATEAVTGGLPVHIAAKILGHSNLATTESYLAISSAAFIEDAYRAFLSKRRAMRPEAEYREPTGEEWREFEELREAQARARRLRTPIRNPLPARARPASVARCSTPIPPPVAAWPTSSRTCRPYCRGPHQRLARRSRRPPGQPHRRPRQACRPRQDGQEHRCTTHIGMPVLIPDNRR